MTSKEHNAICKNCEIRKFYAKMDFHFSWADCPYDCENDIEHEKEKIARQMEREKDELGRNNKSSFGGKNREGD